jgi:phosphatidylglycerophosphate synthase
MTAVVLGVSVTAMIAVTVLTRRPPAAPVPDLDTYLDRWSAAHDGYDARPTRLLRGWLTLMHRLGRPLAGAGVLPDVVTAWAVVVALAVPALAGRGGGCAIAAAVLVVVNGLGDGLDGAVAVLTDRASRWGYVLDSVADRVTEGAFLAATWVVGAPAWLVVSAGAAAFLLEYIRARAGNAGADPAQTITVGERPSRIICCAIALALAGIAPGRASLLAGASVAVLLALSLVALGQLVVSLHRQLR